MPRSRSTDRRLRVAIRRRRLLVDVEDYAGLLRARARHYRERAELLIDQAVAGDSVVDPEERDPVPVLDEALACRMVAEELEQRADELVTLG